MSENLRVLYVAMTRAKEQFITFVTVENLESKLKRLSSNIHNGKINSYGLRKINSDADMLLLCSLLHSDGDILRDFIPYSIDVQSTSFKLDVEITDEITAEESENNFSFVDYDEDILNEIKNKLSYSYDKRELSKLSSKLTASSLDDFDRGFEYITSSMPSFINKGGLTPAERGTAMHTFMQYSDYSNAKADLTGEINRLVNEGLLSNEQANSLDTAKLNGFFSSEVMNMINSADNVYKEFKVSSFINADEIYDINTNEKVLVQGIADCVIEIDNELILVDYKTDSVSDEDELLNRYKKQIGFYKAAIEKTLEKPVIKSLLYSFSLGKCCYYK